MEIAIRYLTTFTYDTHVSESHNALRACPAANGLQRLVSYAVTVDPEARISSYWDYWGTRVDSFGIVGNHTRLTVVADAVVDTVQPNSPGDGGAWPLDVAGLETAYEYRVPSPHVSWNRQLVDFGRRVTAGASTVVEAVTAVQQAVSDLLTYNSESTVVGTSVAEIWEHRSGVCQDYAHLAIAVFRSLGLPARYVSGYLYAVDSATGERPTDREEIEVATHAWVEVAIPGFGWWGLDPTNRLVAGERHVKIGHGRDYEDVTPLRGVYHGEAESGGLAATVTMSRSGLDRYLVQPQPAYQRRQEQQQQQQ